MITSTGLTAALHIKIPSVPNFLISEAQSDLAVSRSFSIAEFTDAQLKEIGEAWTKNLLATAQQHRNAPKS